MINIGSKRVMKNGYKYMDILGGIHTNYDGCMPGIVTRVTMKGRAVDNVWIKLESGREIVCKAAATRR